MSITASIRLTKKLSSDPLKNVEHERSASTASKVLQDNHDKHHVFFNGEGYHNHITHAILTLWSLGASSEEIQRAYDLNKVFQRPQIILNHALCHDLLDEAEFISRMGNDQYYKAFLELFEREIASSTWQEVVQKYLFAGDKRADLMFVRLFDSFLHPLIHLGFGVEFGQPAIIAEALAQTACHKDWIGELLFPAEVAARDQSSTRSIVELLDAVQADATIANAPQWTDGDKIRDGILGRAADSMISYLAEIKVDPDQLSPKLAEMINAAAYLTAAAQRPGKVIKFDFYLLHCLTSATFFIDFLEQTWVSEENKARLLAWKIRMDLVMYASRKSPALHLDIISSYSPRTNSDWPDIKRRVCRVIDDGHASKVIRSLARAQGACKSYQDSNVYRLQDGDWYRIALMAIDSLDSVDEASTGIIQFDGPGRAWVRSAGFDQAWQHVPDKTN